MKEKTILQTQFATIVTVEGTAVLLTTVILTIPTSE